MKVNFFLKHILLSAFQDCLHFPTRIIYAFVLLISALQRQMGYMNDDGSFRMFRDDHKPSVWWDIAKKQSVEYLNFCYDFLSIKIY